MGRWAEYEFFVQVVEAGSISKAAEALSSSTPTVSRHLTALEKRLGARLIERSTRRSSLTEVGQNFYARCKTLLDDMTEAEEEASSTSISPTGTLRVTASLSLMLKHVTKLLPRFSQKYPNINIQLIAENRYYDIIDNDVDVAIRTREYEPDSTLVVRRLAGTRRILAASPAYIDRYGTPATPAALTGHKYLGYSYHNPHELVFEREGKTVAITTTPLLDANDGQIARLAAVEGMGILAQPLYVIYDDLAAGRLVPVMLDWKLPPMSVNLVYRRRNLLPAKTRVFLDFISEDFHKNKYEQRWEAVLTKGQPKKRP